MNRVIYSNTKFPMIRRLFSHKVVIISNRFLNAQTRNGVSFIMYRLKGGRFGNVPDVVVIVKEMVKQRQFSGKFIQMTDRPNVRLHLGLNRQINHIFNANVSYVNQSQMVVDRILIRHSKRIVVFLWDEFDCLIVNSNNFMENCYTLSVCNQFVSDKSIKQTSFFLS